MSHSTFNLKGFESSTKSCCPLWGQLLAFSAENSFSNANPINLTLVTEIT